MSDVKRYTPFDQWGQELTKCMEQDERGFYVRATDYDALASERDALKARLAEEERDLRTAFGWGDPFDMTPEDAAVWHRLQSKYAADSADEARNG